MPYSEVKFCDLINSADAWLKEGDMLKFYCGFVQHFAIYVGEVESKRKNCIVHLLNGGGVMVDELSNLPNTLYIKCVQEFTQNGTVHIYRPAADVSQQIKKRALAQVGPHNYNFLTNNCEKWARGVYNNNSGTSYQVLLLLPLVNCLLPRKLRI